MSSVTPTSASLFSVPLEHQWRIDFSGALDVVTQRATGLDRFIGDDANQLLRYVTTDDFISQMVNPDRSTSPVLTPIVFTGPAGTGKTSLAMSLISRLMVEIENRHADHPLPLNGTTDNRGGNVASHTKPVYLTGAEFYRRFYTAIDTDSVDEFRQSILQSPALLLDDLQQLAAKPPAQRELESLLDLASYHHLPVFVICNRCPGTVDGFSQRLVSRLASGLTIPFHPPGAEARGRIARDLAEIHQIQLTEDALELLNNQFEVTVPRMEHLFCQIKLKQRIAHEDGPPNNGPSENHLREGIIHSSDPAERDQIDATLLKQILAPSDEDLFQMIRLIQKRVAKEFKLNLSDLKSNSRKQTVVLARGVAIYLTRSLLGTSFLKIGNAFGNRDHSTILHSFRKIEAQYLPPVKVDCPAEPGCSTPSAKIKPPLTVEQRKNNSMIDRLKQELTDQFATQINIA